MKVKHKYLVIALLLSLIFSVSAVAAQEDMTFEQSDINEVYTETLSVSSENQEINSVEDVSSVSEAENQKLQANENDRLTAGEGTFSEIRNNINNTADGGTIYLNGKTYIGDGNNIEVNKNITIIGGTSSNPTEYATLDARGLSSMLQVSNGTIVVLKYIKFINGKTDNKGIGAAINAKSNMTIENCQFINNTAQDGGALYLTGHIYHIVKHDDPSWESYKTLYPYDEWYHQEVQSSGYEGYYPSSPYDHRKYYYSDYESDLYIRENFIYSINNCQFSENNATNNGGAVYYKTDSYGSHGLFNITNSVFRNNVAKTGGAVYFTYYGKAEKCTFTDNSATVDAGAVYSYGSTRIQSCDFSNNHATKRGGAFYGWFNLLEYSKFTYNHAQEGGAVYGYGTIKYSNFTKNYATDHGGAVYRASAEFCNFIENNALRGGATYTGTMTSCNFTSNSATEGGAIYGSTAYSNKFVSNQADYGGAIYCTDSRVENNIFINNRASDSSTAIYISSISTFDYIKGNNLSPSKTEIFIKKITDFNGLNIVILDNQTIEVCEGELKIYASVTNNEGVKFSCDEIIFIVGVHELKTKVIDNYAEVMFNATPDDNNSVIGIKTSSSTKAKISTALLYVYPYVVTIEVNDAYGYIGTLIQVPVYVYDSTGHTVQGSIYVNYNNNHREIQLVNGRANVVMSLPDKKITLDLIVEYDDVIEIRKVNVLDPDDPIAVIIEMPNNETGYVGKTITVPVNLHDGLGTQLKGDIHVSYLGYEETITLVNGKTDLLISLPVYETTFDIGVSYKGYNSICTVNVLDPTVEANATINLAHNAIGNVRETIKIPVKVVDDDGKPLTGNISISYNGKETSQALNATGEALISVVLPDHEISSELIVNYNGNIKSCIIEAIDSTVHTSVVIKMNENFTGYLGKNITVPVIVVDSDNKALTGDIFISYNGHHKTQTLVNGQADVFIELPAFETSFELVVSYKGHIETSLINVVYEGAHVNAVITLPSNKTESTGKLIIIPVHVVDGDGNPLEGDVAVYYPGHEGTLTLANGSCAVVINPISDSTSFEVTVAYLSNIAHCLVNVVGPNITTIDAIITLPENESGHVGKTIIIPVSVFDSDNNPLEGKINVYYDGHDETVDLENGHASIVMLLPDSPTSYNLTVMYNGISKVCLITVKPESDNNETNDTAVVIDVEDEITAHTGKTLKIPVSVHDGKGNALTGKILILYNNNERELTLNNGLTNIIMGVPVDPTTFELTIIYEELIKTVKIIVFDANNPMGDLNEVTTNGNGSIVIPFPNDATGKVTVKIGDNIYNGTIINGQVVINITNLPNGTYRGNIGYSGDENYSSSEKTVVIVIKDSNVPNPNSPLANVTEAQTNGDGTVVIPFPNDATGDVIVTIDGKNYTGKIIDGKVVLDIKDLPAGNYTSIVYYLGDGNYSSTVKTIVIVKDGSSVSPNNPMGNLTETETNDDGSISIPFPSDATGEVMVEINGTFYTGRIVDGKVVLDVGNLPTGNYGANVYYFGDGKYSSSTRTITIMVKESNNQQQNTPVNPPAVTQKVSKFTAKKKTFKATKKVKKYKVTLKSDKTPIGNVQVTIKIGKKTFKAKTNAKGKATFKIKKFTQAGKYKAVVKFKGNGQYKATSKKVKITIK